MSSAKAGAPRATPARFRTVALGHQAVDTGKPRQMLSRSMSRARVLKRRSQGFAAMCSVVRVSGSEGLDRVAAEMVGDLPRRLPIRGFLAAEARRWLRGTPRDALTGWVRRVGTGTSGGR